MAMELVEEFKTKNYSVKKEPMRNEQIGHRQILRKVIIINELNMADINNLFQLLHNESIIKGFLPDIPRPTVFYSQNFNLCITINKIEYTYTYKSYPTINAPEIENKDNTLEIEDNSFSRYDKYIKDKKIEEIFNEKQAYRTSENNHNTINEIRVTLKGGSFMGQTVIFSKQYKFKSKSKKTKSKKTKSKKIKKSKSNF